MFTKKINFITLFLIIFFSSGNLFCQETFDYKVSFKFGFDSNIFKYSEHEDYGGYSIVGFDSKKYSFTTGIRVDQIKTDCFADVLFTPVYFNKFKLGIVSTGHFYQYKDLFYEIDILPGFYYETIPDDYFTFKCALCYFGKFSVIKSIQDAKPVLPVNSLGIILSFNWDTDFCSVYFDLKSYDYFDYPIFCSPIFVTGIEKKVFRRFTIGAKVVTEWIDMFTIEASPTLMTISTYVKVGLL